MSINLTEAARNLRQKMTDAENVLWKRLKARQLDGLKFRRQEQIGPFIVDFVCFETGVIIEADGGQHAVERARDEERTHWLNAQKYLVLRFWNNEVLTNTEGVLEAIRLACIRRPSPRPSPTEGRG